jgi:hypothetical protein
MLDLGDILHRGCALEMRTLLETIGAKFSTNIADTPSKRLGSTIKQKGGLRTPPNSSSSIEYQALCPGGLATGRVWCNYTSTQNTT